GPEGVKVVDALGEVGAAGGRSAGARIAAFRVFRLSSMFWRPSWLEPMENSVAESGAKNCAAAGAPIRRDADRPIADPRARLRRHLIGALPALRNATQGGGERRRSLGGGRCVRPHASRPRGLLPTG